MTIGNGDTVLVTNSVDGVCAEFVGQVGVVSGMLPGFLGSDGTAYPTLYRVDISEGEQTICEEEELQKQS